MLMYDYPLKTDMESVRNMLPSCPNMFLMPCSKSDLHTHTHTHATCLDRLVPTFLLFLDKQAAVQWTFAYNGYKHCQAAG